MDCMTGAGRFFREGESMRRSVLSVLAMGAAVVSTAGFSAVAEAIQFTPSGTARLHTLGAGQPGAQWNTGGTSSGGALSFDAGTGVATLTAALDVMNYYDPANGACSTDAGSNCDFNFAPDLNVTLDAQFVGSVVTPAGGPFVNVTLNFATTANATPDLVVTDPADLGFGSVLEGDWQAGFFGGNPTTGLSISVLYDTVNLTATFSTAQVSGFLALDAGTAYASLFESGSNYFGLNIASLSNFSSGVGGLDGIVAYAIANGTLPTFSAEGNGQVYRLTSGDFVVPEPATALLLSAGLALLGARRRG